MIKNKILQLLIIITFYCSLEAIYSQNNIVLNVKYSFVHQKEKDTTVTKIPFKESVILSVGKRSSRYCSERRYKEMISINDTKTESTNSKSAGSTKIVSGGPLLLVNDEGTLMREEIMKSFDNNELILNSLLGFKSFKVTTEIPEIKWKIDTVTKKIGEITCQKAVGKYGGRTYTAWFAPSLPFNDGPWKLTGLPGLILEASDDREEVKFIFIELSRNSFDQEKKVTSFNESSSNIPVSLKSYEKLKKAFETDPVGVSKAQFPNANIAIANISGTSKKTASNLKIKKYNPLEIK